LKILSHRGYWLSSEEKNTHQAFFRSFNKGFGTETDVRDLCGQLVISHDPANIDSIPFQAFSDTYNSCNLPLALNIKSDGLAQLLKNATSKAGIQNYFAFDMSIPDMIHYKNAAIPFYTRLSEIERDAILFEEATGVWLDSFHHTWFSTETINSILSKGKSVCIVSPELHGREPESMWRLLKSFCNHENMMICTDLPEQAQHFFRAQND
jgi:glycerophosphoryl diester phosphodiesterase